MKKATAGLLSLALLLAGTPPAWAGGCRVVSYPVRTYYPPVEKVVVKEVVNEIVREVAATTVLAVPVNFALYGVTYAQPSYAPVPVVPSAPYVAPAQAPAYAPAASHCESKLAELEKRLWAIERSDVQATQSAQPEAPAARQTALPPAVAPPSGAVGLFQAKCASCHERATASAKGGKFVMFDKDALVKFTDKQARNVLGRCRTNNPALLMPKGGPPLTDSELATVGDWFMDYDPDAATVPPPRPTP